NPALREVSSPRRHRQAKGRRHDCHSPRDDRFHPDDCPDHTAVTLGLIKAICPTKGKGEPNAGKSSGARRRRQDHGGEPWRPVMSRLKPTLASRSRQPRTEPCGIQPRMRACSTCVFRSCVRPCPPTANTYRTLLTNLQRKVVWDDSLTLNCVGGSG